MNEPQINVDHFYHRPVDHVVGLLTEHSEIPAISRELESAGVDVAAVEILIQRHQVHDVGYFGPGTFEQFPIPDTG